MRGPTGFKEPQGSRGGAAGWEGLRELTVILVSWKDAVELEAAVESLAAARRRMAAGGPRVSLVVADNAGQVDRGRILSLWPDALLLINEDNPGYGPALNRAADLASGEVLLFLNPDTRAEGEPFSEILRAFESTPAAAAVAPRLLDFEGSQAGRPGQLAPPHQEDQFTFQLRRLPRLAFDARELLLIDHLLPNNRVRRRSRYADSDRESPFPVEQAAAAALAVRRSAFRALGGFDERFVPAWFEDVDLCARLAEEGKILYWPAARFRHRGGVSAAELGYDRFLPIYYRNALRYRTKHYRPLARAFYRALLVMGMLLRFLLLPLRPSVPRSRGESARAYLLVLALALGLSGPPPASRLPPPAS